MGGWEYGLSLEDTVQTHKILDLNFNDLAK